MATSTPVTGKARLHVTIINQTKAKELETVYRLTFLDPHPSVGYPAWRLTKTDGTFYDVILTRHGPECSCPDWNYRRDGKDPKGCKHVASLKAVGLLRKDN